MISWRTLRAADLVMAAVLILSGVAALVSVRQMRVGFVAEFQPRLFPTAIGLLLIVVGVIAGITAWRSPARALAGWPPPDRAKRIAVILGGIAAYVALIDLLGMPLASFLVVWFEVWFLGTYRWYVPLAVGVCATAVLYFVFMIGLGLTFPTGLFEP